MILQRLSPQILLSAITALGVAGLAIWSQSSERYFFLLVLGVLIPVPIVIRGLRRQFDPFEPIVILSICLFVLFFLRPVAHLAYGVMAHGGMSIDRGFNKALLVAIVGVAALYVGYATALGRGMARRLTPPPQMLKPDATIMFASGLLVVGFVLYALYIEQVGGLAAAQAVLRGRDPSEYAALNNTTAYFRFGAFLTIPATLLLLEAAAAKRRALFVLLTAVGAALLLVVITAPRGDRLWLLLLLMSIFVLPYLRRQRRPKVRTLVLVGVISFAFGITFLADIRVPAVREASPTELFKRSAQNPFHGWRDFILGADTEMFAILALEAERVPSVRAHEPGITIINLATTWIPRRLYPGKPQEADFLVYEMLFPIQASVTKGGTAPSIFGGFYYDSGLLGVFVGAFVFGVLARILYEYYIAFPTSVGGRLLFAAALPFIVVTVRGSPPDTVGRMAYVVFPILVGIWWTGRRESRSVRRVGTAAAPQ